LDPAHIGISFSDSSIKALSISGSRSNPELRSAVLPLERGVISEGKIVDIKTVSQKLSDLKTLFKSPFLFIAIPDELSFIFQTSVPVVKNGNVAESVAFTIEENVPLSLTETIFDFTPVEIKKTGAEEFEAKVIVAACVKKEVEKFAEAVKSSGFELVGCLHESQAIANSVIPKNFVKTSCIVHSRKDRVGIYLVKNNIVYFSTLRSIGKDYEAEFMDEYKKFLEYSDRYNENGAFPIDVVFVCGEFEYAKKTAETIMKSNNAVKNAKLANVWSNILRIEEKTPSISYEDSLNLSGPIGAVLSDII